MARTDEILKKLFKNKENFADLFNGTLFHGKQVMMLKNLSKSTLKLSTSKNLHQQKMKFISQNVTEIYVCNTRMKSYKSS